MFFFSFPNYCLLLFTTGFRLSRVCLIAPAKCSIDVIVLLSLRRCWNYTNVSLLSIGWTSFSEGGFFNAIMSFPSNYPNSPPSVKFTSEIWHPNG